jgi:hypothetical protein
VQLGGVPKLYRGVIVPHTGAQAGGYSLQSDI